MTTETTQRTGEQQAQERAEAATQLHEMAAEALEPTANADYGPEARQLGPSEGAADFDTADDILSDYRERTDQAADDNDGVSGNQDAPSYQQPTGTLADPDSDDPDARIDPAQESQEQAQDGETAQPQQGPTGPTGPAGETSAP